MNIKKEVILETAYQLFSEKGYHLSLSEVTAAVGLQKQSIYNYYKSKDDLITAMLDREIDLYTTDLNAVVKKVQPLPPKEQLNTLMIFIVTYFSDLNKLKIRRWLTLMQTQENLSPLSEKVRLAELDYYQAVAPVVKRGVEEGLFKNANHEEMLLFYLVFTRGLIDGLMVLSVGSEYREKIDVLIKNFWQLVENK